MDARISDTPGPGSNGFVNPDREDRDGYAVRAGGEDEAAGQEPDGAVVGPASDVSGKWDR
jgi:hypothetical protein